jgi:Zn-finger protein
MDKNPIKEFKDKLNEELWQDIFDNTSKDVNNFFYSFLNIYLNNCYSCFPPINIYERQQKNHWITKGIINSCKIKKVLYLLARSSKDEILRNYYLKYSKTLTKVIKSVKKLYFNNKISHAHNKVKATWNIIKSNIGKNMRNEKTGT